MHTLTPSKALNRNEKVNSIRFVSHHAVHATDSCYRPSFEVLVVAIELIERECLKSRSEK